MAPSRAARSRPPIGRCRGAPPPTPRRDLRPRPAPAEPGRLGGIAVAPVVGVEVPADLDLRDRVPSPSWSGTSSTLPTGRPTSCGTTAQRPNGSSRRPAHRSMPAADWSGRRQRLRVGAEPPHDVPAAVDGEVVVHVAGLPRTQLETVRAVRRPPAPPRCQRRLHVRHASAVTGPGSPSSWATSPRASSTPSSTQRTPPCSAAAGWTARSTVGAAREILEACRALRAGPLGKGLPTGQAVATTAGCSRRVG